MIDSSDRGEIRNDSYLQWMKKLGIPLAVVCIAALWLGHTFNHPALGTLFFVTLPVTLLIGFAYNVRFVMLAVRRNKKANQ